MGCHLYSKGLGRDGAEDGDAVTGAQSGISQGTRKSLDHLEEFTARNDASALLEGGGSGVRLQGLEE